MNDRPNARELLDAVEQLLRDDLVPALEGHLQYQARVAANVVGIVAREIDGEEAQLNAERLGLSDLLGQQVGVLDLRQALRTEVQEFNQMLSEKIRAGEVDSGPLRDRVLDHLESVVDQKLQVALGERHRIRTRRTQA